MSDCFRLVGRDCVQLISSGSRLAPTDRDRLELVELSRVGEESGGIEASLAGACSGIFLVTFRGAISNRPYMAQRSNSTGTLQEATQRLLIVDWQKTFENVNQTTCRR